MSTYTTGFPNANQSLGNSRPKVFDNWQIITDRFAVDHREFNEVTGAGKHNFVRFPVAQSTPATAAGEIALYPKTDAAATPQLYLRQQSSPTEIQMTKTLPATVLNANGVGSATFYSFLPNNILVISGFTQNSIDGATLNLSVVLSGIITVQLSALGSSSSGTNRALVAQPRSVNPGAGTMVINLQDVNNNDQLSARPVYFYVLGLT